MLQRIINKLNEYRDDKSRWAELAWFRTESDEDYEDLHESMRAKILIGIQFGKRPDDEEFLQFLMTEEIKNGSNDPFQGCSPSLNRVGYLLASYRNPKNVQLFVEAKTANFDTHCGFDWEHILSAGVAKTFEQITSVEDDEVKAGFHSYFESLEKCDLSENDIERWHHGKAEWYPEKIELLNEEELIELAFELEDHDLAKKMVDQWQESMQQDQDSLQSLKYYRMRLRDHLAEIELAEKLLRYTNEDNMRAHAFIDIAQLHVNLNQLELSWKSIQRAIRISDRLDSARLTLVADKCIDIINHEGLACDFFNECYQFGINHVRNPPTQEQSKKRLKAANKMKDDDGIAYFEKLVKQGEAEWEEIMKQIRKGQRGDG